MNMKKAYTDTGYRNANMVQCGQSQFATAKVSPSSEILESSSKSGVIEIEIKDHDHHHHHVDLAEVDLMQTSLGPHITAYNNSIKHKIQLDNVDSIDQIHDITNYLKTNKVKCFKYNYSLESNVQNFSSFQGYIKLSADGQRL